MNFLLTVEGRRRENKSLSSLVVHHHPLARKRAGMMEHGFPSEGMIACVSMSMSVSWQASTPLTTRTVCSPTCTTVSMASLENWLTPSSRQLARSTLMTMSTGFWETCASAGRKARVFYQTG